MGTLTRLVDSIEAIFRPLPDETVAEWAEHAIILPRGQSADDGANPNWALTPDIPEILEQVKNPDCREIVLCFAAQCSKTLTLLCGVGWLIAHTPMNILWVLPGILLKERVGQERIRKTYELSDVDLLPGKSDKSKDKLRFALCYLALAIASSSGSLSSDPMGIVVIDEEDENPEFASGAADPTELAGERTRTFRDRCKIFRACTPRRLERGVWPAYHTTRMHTLRVKCLRCGKWIKLTFDQIKWPKDSYGHSEEPEKIKTEHLAHYECQECGEKLLDHEREKLLAAGNMRWECETPDRPFTRVGYHKPVLYSIFEDFSSIAAKFISSKSDIAKLQNFNHSWLAEPREVGAKYVKESQMREQLTGGYDWGHVPEEVQVLTAGADVGGDHLWVCLIGWGYEGEIFKIASTRIQLEDTALALKELGEWSELDWQGNEKAKLMAGAIDCGYNRERVFDFARQNRLWRPVEGADRRLTAPWLIQVADPKYRYGAKAKGLKRYVLHTDHFQDILQGYLERGRGQGSGFFHIPNQCEDRYLKHLSNEMRKKVPGSRGHVSERWQPRYKGAPQHLRDATYYAIAIGHIMGYNKLRRPRVVDTDAGVLAEITDKRKPSKKKRLSRLSQTWRPIR